MNITYKGRLNKKEWYVKDIPLSLAQELVKEHHYSGGGANTATYRHGLFKNDSEECFGVAWWIPPTKSAAHASYPKDWKAVLALSRLVVCPGVPKNAASFLLAKSMKLIDRVRWPCLVTYADEWQGHTGGIYKATNWEYMGLTSPEAVWTLGGRMVARKAGPKTRTKSEMEALGAVCLGRFPKHKFRHTVEAKMKKPVVEYVQSAYNHITEGKTALLMEVYGHPCIKDGLAAHTSPVIHIFEDGEFETHNTIYVPRSQ